MAFRLPRLPETSEIVEANRRPSFAFQRWWQSIVRKLEDQENTQDQMLLDIQAALTNAGIALDRANAVMADIPPVSILHDYSGAVLAGQLPRNVQVTRYDDTTDVTTSATWSATTISGDATYTIGANDGVLNITAINGTTVIEATSVYNGISRSRRVTVYRTLQDPPPSSGSTTAYDSTIVETTADTYGAANAELTLTCGASGEVDLAAPLVFTTLATMGTFNAYGKWQVSAAGAGVWTDVDTEVMSSIAAVPDEEGWIEVVQTATGLTPSSDYDFQLLLRNASGTSPLYYAGTASATTS